MIEKKSIRNSIFVKDSGYQIVSLLGTEAPSRGVLRKWCSENMQ